MPDQTLTFDHIGLVVASIEAEAPRLANVLHLTRWTKRFDDLALGVSVCFATGPAGLVVELVAPLGPDSPVARAARQKRDCLNQIGYRTDDMAGTRAHFVAGGALILSEPKPGDGVRRRARGIPPAAARVHRRAHRRTGVRPPVRA
jgi:methylmalonyl-CoA/ethylmalonyl-CoA epimerase